MVEIQCPACGAAGRAPKEKVQTRLICRKCLKVFHVAPSGRTVLGEPPVPGQTPTAGSSKKTLSDRSQEVDRWFERLTRIVFSPLSLSLVVGLVVLAVLAALFAPRHTETLQDRVARAAKAAVEGDLQVIRELATADTVGDAVNWYIMVRPQCDNMLQHLGPRKLAVETWVKQQDPAERSVEVVALVSMYEELERKGNALPDPTIESVQAGQPTLSLAMAWKIEGREGWKLNGTRTVELWQPAP